jgi:transposase-like protein
MRGYSEAVKADVRRRMSPPQRQRVARISEKLGIHVITLYKWRKPWRLQGEVVPASEKEPDGWSAANKFTVVLETAGLNATELSAYCRERGLFPEQVSRWRQAAHDANAKPSLTIGEGPGGGGGIAGAAKKVGGLLLGGRGRLTSAAHRRKVIELIGEANAAGAGLVRACGEIGIWLRTLKRWRKAFLGDGDGKDRRKAVLASSFTG